MNKFHIVYKEKSSDFMSRGVNISADTMEEAIILFRVNNLGIILVCYLISEFIYLPS